MKTSPVSYLPVALLLLAGATTASALDITARYWRFSQTKLRDGVSANSIQLSEFDLLYQGARIPGAAASNPGGNSPSGELPAFAVDGSTSTKWLDFNKVPLVLAFPAPVTVDGYRFATGGDATERDPVSWNLEWSADGATWTLAESRTDYPTPAARGTYTPAILFAAPTPLTINRFVTTRPKIGTGESATLEWAVVGSSSVSISPSVGTVTETGTFTVSPTEETTYTLTATKGAETLTATAKVSPIVRGPQTFQYFRFTPLALRQSTATSIQISEFAMISGTTRLTGATATNPGGLNNVGEGPAQAVDGNTATKWLDFNKAPLVLNFGTPVSPDGYRFATANDFDERDPISWKLEGSANGTTWALLDSVESFPAPAGRLTFSGDIPLPSVIAPTATFSLSPAHLQSGESTTLTWATQGATSVSISPGVTGGTGTSGTATATPPAGLTTYTLTANNTAGTATLNAPVFVEGPASSVTYKFFRFTTTAQRNASAANSLQIAEVELSLGGQILTGATLTSPGGDSPAAEAPAFAADGDPSTKWLDFNRGSLVFEYPAPVSIDGYRIATAGDAPERDPVAWTLEGSTDGTAWTAIDTRSIGFVVPEARGAYTSYFRFPGEIGAPVTATAYDAAADTMTLTFTSQPGLTYFIKSSPDLVTWSTALDDVESEGTSTTKTVPAIEDRLFFKVVQKP